MLTKFSAVIFDMDGLLLDSEPIAKRAFDTVCHHYELGDLSDLFMQFVGTNTERGNAIVQHALGQLIDVEVFNHEWRGLYASWVKNKAIPLKQGVIPLLDYLKSINMPMGVATSSNTDLASHKLMMAGIIDYFDIVIGGDKVENSKPAPDIYLRTAAELNCEPESCLAFEDSPNGVKSAVSAAMTVIQIPDLLKPDDALLSLGHIVLDCISDALNVDFNDSVDKSCFIKAKI